MSIPFNTLGCLPKVNNIFQNTSLNFGSNTVPSNNPFGVTQTATNKPTQASPVVKNHSGHFGISNNIFNTSNFSNLSFENNDNNNNNNTYTSNPFGNPNLTAKNNNLFNFPETQNSFSFNTNHNVSFQSNLATNPFGVAKPVNSETSFGLPTESIFKTKSDNIFISNVPPVMNNIIEINGANKETLESTKLDQNPDMMFDDDDDDKKDTKSSGKNFLVNGNSTFSDSDQTNQIKIQSNDHVNSLRQLTINQLKLIKTTNRTTRCSKNCEILHGSSEFEVSY